MFKQPERMPLRSFQSYSAVGGWKACIGIGAVLLLGLGGCADRNKDNIPESPATSGEVGKAVDKAGEAIENTAEKAGEVAVKAGDAAQDGATTAKVKAMLMANKTIDASKINVDTKNNIVYLRGTVLNAAQSKLAVAITKKNAPGYSINNLLKVAGNKPPAKAPAKKG